MKSTVITNIIDSNSTISYLEKSTTDEVGNRKWDLTQSGEVRDIITKILDYEGNHLIYLPFDQSAGKLMTLLNRPEIRSDYQAMLKPFKRERSPSIPYVCLHIRRGDCTERTHPDWYVSNMFYEILIDYLINTLPIGYSIVVCTQGSVDWLRSKERSKHERSKRIVIRTTEQLFVNEKEMEDFRIMANANILFCAGSSFSRWASYIGSNQTVIDITRLGKHPIKTAITINPDDPTKESIEIIHEHLKKAKFI